MVRPYWSGVEASPRDEVMALTYRCMQRSFDGRPQTIMTSEPSDDQHHVRLTVEPYAWTESEPLEPISSGKSVGRRTRPIRILHVVNRLDTGGTEYGVLKIMSGLGDDCFVHGLCTLRGFTPKLSAHPVLRQRLFVAGHSQDGLQFPLFRLARIIRTFRPDIVHSRNWGGIEAIPAARLARVPVAIHSEHGYELEMLSGLPTRRRLLRRGVYSLVDKLFAVTRDLQQFHAKQAWISPDRIGVIYNGVDTRRFRPRPELRLNLRAELGIPADSFVVGGVGRLVPIKDFLTLLRASASLIRCGVNAYVLLVGSGPEMPRLQEYIKESAEIADRIFFLGSSDRVPDVLNAMDAFVLASVCEGMSNTLLEAMACGLPSVATSVGGNPEVVEENRTGWLFSPQDINGLAERLSALAARRELRAQLGEAARKRILQSFTLEGMLNRYKDLYCSLAEEHRLVATS